MSRWTETFENHQIHETLSSLGVLLDQAAEKLGEDADGLESLERLRSLYAFVTRILSKTDPELVPVQPLNNMMPHLNNVVSEVRNYNSNQNTGHLSNANKHAEGVLAPAGSIPVFATREDVDGLRDAITSFRRSAGQLIHNLEQEASELRSAMETDRDTSDQLVERSRLQIGELESDLGKLESDIQVQKSRLDTAIAEFQNQFSKQQDIRQEQFAEAENERSDTNREAIDEYEARFAKIEEDHRTEFKSICDDSRKKLDEFSTSAEKIAKGIISSLEDYREQAENLVNVIGNTGMVGGYQKTANTARWTARIWQAIAVGSFLGLIWFAIKVFSATQGPDFTWSVFSGRVFVAGTFALAAAFAARQSDRHEEAERYNRRVELELASIGPYLAGLPKDKQDEIKEELARRLFGQKPEQKRSKDEVTGTNADVLGLLRDLVTELIKKQP